MPSPRLAALLLAALLAGCGGLEGNMRDLNRSLYRGLGGETARQARPTAAGEGAGLPCFSADTGLLYTSQTGRCAAGYVAVGADLAEREFRSTAGRDPVAGRAAPEIVPYPQRTAPSAAGQAVAAAAPLPFGRTVEGYALCYSDTTGHIFEAEVCPRGSRWIDTPEAEALQRAQLGAGAWCYFAGSRLLYRSRACRPGDQVLSVADANRLWDSLPPDRRTRTRPSDAGGAVQPVPPVSAAPRGGVNATPLPR